MQAVAGWRRCQLGGGWHLSAANVGRKGRYERPAGGALEVNSGPWTRKRARRTQVQRGAPYQGTGGVVHACNTRQNAVAPHPVAPCTTLQRGAATARSAPSAPPGEQPAAFLSVPGKCKSGPSGLIGHEAELTGSIPHPAALFLPSRCGAMLTQEGFQIRRTVGGYKERTPGHNSEGCIQRTYEPHQIEIGEVRFPCRQGAAMWQRRRARGGKERSEL